VKVGEMNTQNMSYRKSNASSSNPGIKVDNYIVLRKVIESEIPRILFNIQFLVKYHVTEIPMPTNDPINDAILVFPNSGNYSSFLNHDYSDDDIDYRIASSTRIEMQPMQDISIRIVNTSLKYSINMYNTSNIIDATTKKLIADDVLMSVASSSSADMSLNIKNAGVFTATI
jgi:hypothetical protein